MLDPWNLLKLLPTFRERHKEDVAANVLSEDRQHFCAAHLSQARGLNVAGTRDAEARVVIEKTLDYVRGNANDRKD